MRRPHEMGSRTGSTPTPLPANNACAARGRCAGSSVVDVRFIRHRRPARGGRGTTQPLAWRVDRRAAPMDDGPRVGDFTPLSLDDPAAALSLGVPSPTRRGPQTPTPPTVNGRVRWHRRRRSRSCTTVAQQDCRRGPPRPGPKKIFLAVRQKLAVAIPASAGRRGVAHGPRTESAHLG